MTVLTALVIFCASLVQGVAGFGMSVVAVPLLVEVGYPMSKAVPLVLVGSVLNSFHGALQLRKFIPWREVALAVVCRLVGIFLGSQLLVELAGLETAWLRVFLGTTVLVLILLQFFGLRLTPEHISRFKLPSFLVSGVSHGAVGMGGPFLALWLVSTNWEPRVIRAFLFATYSLTLPFALLMMLANFGQAEMSSSLAGGLLTFPLALLGAHAGCVLARRFDARMLKLVVLLLLAVMGTSSIARGLAGS